MQGHYHKTQMSKLIKSSSKSFLSYWNLPIIVEHVTKSVYLLETEVQYKIVSSYFFSPILSLFVPHPGADGEKWCYKNTVNVSTMDLLAEWFC